MYNFHRKGLQQQLAPQDADQYYANTAEYAQGPEFEQNEQYEDAKDGDLTVFYSQTSQERIGGEYNDIAPQDQPMDVANAELESEGSHEGDEDHKQDTLPNYSSMQEEEDVKAPEPHRSRREAQILADYSPPGPDATESEVLAYYRRLIKSHNVTPPRSWREIRFELPAFMNELRLFPPQMETIQNKEPSPCLVLMLEDMLPEGMTPSNYAVQMVEYLFDLMKYQNASTAMTTLRFVKKGSMLSQLVVTFAKDIRLASRILEQLQAVGYPAGFGPPIYDYPANATFEITDYKFRMHDGKGISEADISELLNPFRQSGTGDISVIEGYEPGVFYVPVKRPETVYSFLWNPFCSFMFQSALFERYGVLVTMALCPHEFLKKGIPYYIQKREKEKEKARRLRGRVHGNDNGLSEHYHGDEPGSQDDDDDDDLRENDNDDVEDDALSSTSSRGSGTAGIQPSWGVRVEDEVDIFEEADLALNAQTPSPKEPLASQNSPLPYNRGFLGADANPLKTASDGLVLVDDEEEAQIDRLLHTLKPSAPPGAGPEAAGEPFAGAEPPFPPPPPLTSLSSSLPPPSYLPPPWAYEASSGGEGGFARPPLAPPPPSWPREEPGMTGSAGGGARGDLAYPNFPRLVEESEEKEEKEGTGYRDGLEKAPPPLHLREMQPNAGADSYYTAFAVGSQPRGPEAGMGFASPEYGPMVGDGDNKEGVDNGLLQEGPYVPNQPIISWIMSTPGHAEAHKPANYEYQSNPYSGYKMDNTYYANPPLEMTEDGKYNYYYPPPLPPPETMLGAPQSGNEIEGSLVAGYGAAEGDYYNSYNYVVTQGLEDRHGAVDSVNSRPNARQSVLPTPPGPPPPPSTMGVPPYPQQESSQQPNFYPLVTYPLCGNEASLQPPCHEAHAKGRGVALDRRHAQTMHPDDAARLVAAIRERVRVAFPAIPPAPNACADTQLDESAAETSAEAIEASSLIGKDGIMGQVPTAAQVPPATAEIDELMNLLEESHGRIMQLLGAATVPALATARSELMALLTVALPTCEETRDWELVGNEPDEAPSSPLPQPAPNGSDGEAEVPTKRLPALLPYLLTTHEGTQIAALLVVHYPGPFLPLLTRYVLPFFLDMSVVQSACVPALRVDPSRDNPLVTRVLQHWVPLSQWFHDHIEARSRKEEKSSGMLQKRGGGGAAGLTSAQVAAKRLISQIGNTIDSILAAMSTEQRWACREWSAQNCSVHAFVRGISRMSGQCALPQPSIQEREVGELAKGSEGTEKVDTDDTSCKSSLSELWGLHGAVLRTILRLYLNANIINGAGLVQCLFENPLHPEEGSGVELPQPSSQDKVVCIRRPLTRDSLYFIIVTLSKSHTSPTLSTQTAIFCGRFLRLMEIANSGVADSGSGLNSDPQKSSERGKDSLGEKEALQLFDAAMRSLSSEETYQAMREAYLFDCPGGESVASQAEVGKADSAPKVAPAPHFPRLFEALSSPTPRSLAVSQSLHASGRSPAPHRPPAADASPRKAPALSILGDAPSADSLPALWETQQWEARLRHYPAAGEPFTPLPTGWTASLSRSYGHYYFKPPSNDNNNDDESSGGRGNPSYRHPTDATEYLATPQAFWADTSEKVSLKDVVNRANELKKKSIREQILKQKQATDNNAGVNNNSSSSHTIANDNNNNNTNEDHPSGSGKGAESAVTVAPEVGKDGEPCLVPSPALTFTPLSSQEVEAWRGDQRVRHPLLDAAVLEMCGVTYRCPTSGLARPAKAAAGSIVATAFAPKPMVAKTPAELASRLRGIRRPHYPAVGTPFPELYRGWSWNLSASNGLYVFWSPHAGAEAGLQHPRTQRPYRASPQEFVRTRGQSGGSSDANNRADGSMETIAQEAGIAVVEVEEWMTDQCYRCPAIDSAVVKLFGIQYEYVAEIDDPKPATARKHRRPREEKGRERDSADDHADRHRKRRS